jgi:hypothetical protein
LQSQLFSKGNNILTNSLNLDNANDLNSYRVSGSAIFRHKFKKKGRSFAMSGGYNNSQSDGTENLFSLNKFFQATTFTEQIKQLNTSSNNTAQAKSSLLYTEPLSKKLFWESFYNFSNTQNKVNRQVNNPEKNNERVDKLSVFYDNSVLYNRIGSSIRYAHEGINITAGLATQQLNLKGVYSIDEGLPLLEKPIDKSYMNWTPSINAEFELPNHKYLSFNYGYNVSEPQLHDLQPVPNVNNPAFRTEGNIDLRPERSHHAEVGFNYWNPANFANMNMNVELDKYDDQIVYSQTIENIDKLGIRTTTRPENLSGGQTIRTWLWVNYPIIKTKLTLSANGGFNFGKAPSRINNITNETTNNGGNFGTGINFTPNQKLILGVRGNIRFNNISYSIQKEQNQKINNQSIDGSLKWNFAKKYYLESNFNYAAYQNERFGFDQKVPIWNMSVRRLFLKENKLEMRLAAFDLLNRQVNITQTGNQNYIITNKAETLARYFMLSLTYNVRGHDAKLNKNNMF